MKSWLQFRRILSERDKCANELGNKIDVKFTVKKEKKYLKLPDMSY